MRLRQLFGVEGAKFQVAHLRMRSSRAFLTCLSFLFVALRVFGCAGDGLVEPRCFFFQSEYECHMQPELGFGVEEI